MRVPELVEMNVEMRSHFWRRLGSMGRFEILEKLVKLGILGRLKRLEFDTMNPELPRGGWQTGQVESW